MTPADESTMRSLHKTIDAVGTEMANLRFNTAIAKLVELNNEGHQTRRSATRNYGAHGPDVGTPWRLISAKRCGSC